LSRAIVAGALDAHPWRAALDSRASHAALDDAMSFITAASFVPDDLST